MAWRRPGDKPLSEPMMVRLPTQICVTLPKWVQSPAYRLIVQQFTQANRKKNTNHFPYVRGNTPVTATWIPLTKGQSCGKRVSMWWRHHVLQVMTTPWTLVWPAGLPLLPTASVTVYSWTSSGGWTGTWKSLIRTSSVRSVSALERKCCHFDEIFISGYTESCYFDNFRCSQWWRFRQNEDFSVSVRADWDDCLIRVGTS